MDTLNQIFREAVHPVNVVFTAGLIAVLLYWVLVIVGCFGGDEGHADVGADLHGDVGDANIHADAAHSELSHNGLHISHGSTQLLLRFLHIGDVPLMPLASLAMLCLWVMALLVNHSFNPQQKWGLALLILVPNLIVVAILTHFLAYPIKLVFRAMNQDAAAPAPVAGSLCRILTSTADRQFGEAVIERSGAPLQIHVRTAGEVLRQGDRALVIQETDEPGTYLIALFDPPAISKIINLEKEL